MEEKQILIGGRKQANPNDIMILQADINYTIIYFKDGRKCIVATTLKTLESRFESFNFFRTNRNMLVNLDYVKNFFKPNKQLQMTDNKQVVVSRRRVDGLEKTLLMR